MPATPETAEEKLATLKYMVKHWNEETMNELIKHTGANAFQIGIYASTLRKRGIPLPKKSTANIYSEALITELKKLYNG